MPMYTYRREDGTMFEYRQKFLDNPLTVCPTTGQKVVRVIQTPGIIFKGSGFYVNDSKGASKTGTKGSGKPASTTGEAKSSSSSGEAAAKPTKTESAPSSAAD